MGSSNDTVPKAALQVIHVFSSNEVWNLQLVVGKHILPIQVRIEDDICDNYAKDAIIMWFGVYILRKSIYTVETNLQLFPMMGGRYFNS